MKPELFSSIKIRTIENTEELTLVRNLEALIWKDDDPVPVHHMAAAVKNGGLVIGAFSNENLIGFQYSFAGFNGNEVHLHSHNLGIHPDYRKSGLGERLKRYQKEAALQKGYSVIKWTYDPLETVNGYLNLHKLQAVSSSYIENAYGDLKDGLNKGISSDRFLVEWKIAKDTGRSPAQRNLPLIIELGKTNGLPSPLKVDLSQTANELLVPVPAFFQELKKKNIELAIKWRAATRKVFLHYFNHGWEATDLIRSESDPSMCFYVLSSTKKI